MQGSTFQQSASASSDDEGGSASSGNTLIITEGSGEAISVATSQVSGRGNYCVYGTLQQPVSLGDAQKQPNGSVPVCAEAPLHGSTAGAVDFSCVLNIGLCFLRRALQNRFQRSRK